MIEMPVLTKTIKPLVLGLGFFDCVHKGHRELIGLVKKEAALLGAYSAAATFSNNPYRQFNSEAKLIYTYGERLTLFKDAGLDYCVPFRFDAAFKRCGRDEFLQTLVNNLNLAAVVCGYDYLFGHKGSGDAEYLARFCKSRGIKTVVMERVTSGGERVSSSLIKSLLLSGEIKKANFLLGSPYFMEGLVVRGRGEGGKIGFPTANLKYSRDKLLVKNGVYSTFTLIDGRTFASVTNVGPKPTFGDGSVSVETHIGEGFNGNLYGRRIKIGFSGFLREIKSFSSSQSLTEQIKADLRRSQEDADKSPPK